jgi:hypothetical protein
MNLARANLNATLRTRILGILIFTLLLVACGSSDLSSFGSPDDDESYWPTELDFFQAWGLREGYGPLPRDVESAFQQYVSLWVAETVITSGQLNKESFSSLVSESSPDLGLSSFQAMTPLLNLSETAQTTALWFFYPQTRSESIVGCGLVYSAARHRSMSGKWALSLGEYCTGRVWPEYASSTYSDEDWIQYLNRRFGPLVEPKDPRRNEEKSYGSTESIFGGK